MIVSDICLDCPHSVEKPKHPAMDASRVTIVQTASLIPGSGLVARSELAAEKQMPAKAMIAMRMAAYRHTPANFLK